MFLCMDFSWTLTLLHTLSRVGRVNSPQVSWKVLFLLFQAFVKRLLQISSQSQPTFQCGVLFLLSEVHIILFPTLDLQIGASVSRGSKEKSAWFSLFVRPNAYLLSMASYIPNHWNSYLNPHCYRFSRRKLVWKVW